MTSLNPRASRDARVSQQHLEVLRLTKHFAESDKNFCDVMRELGQPVAIEKIQRRPVPVMICMRVAAAKICGFGGSSFFTIVYLQLQFSGLIQDPEVRRRVGIEWQPSFYAGADPSKLADSIEENTTRDRTIALVDELTERIERGMC